MTPDSHPFTLARRAERMNPSIIREILKVTEQPGIVSLAGGLPSADTFPVQAVRDATEKVLREAPREALQYAASEGYAPLREWVAAHLARQHGMQGPRRPGADHHRLAAGPRPRGQGADRHGLARAGRDADLPGRAAGLCTVRAAGRVARVATTKARCRRRWQTRRRARASPTCCRTSRTRPAMSTPRPAAARWWRAARRPACRWSRTTPTATSGTTRRRRRRWPRAGPRACSTSARSPRCCRPGLRLGYVVAPPALYPKLLQAKQAADLHTSIFNQRVVYEVVRNGLLDAHVPTIRARYKVQRDAMEAALEKHLSGLAQWQRPAGGMFFWLELPAGLDAIGTAAPGGGRRHGLRAGRTVLCRRRRGATRCA